MANNQIQVDSKAPLFKAITNDNKEVMLSDFLGKKIVLYFYPKDNTSGCTKQACSFRDNYERITSFGAIVIGVSPDTLKSHNNFIEKHNLNFLLISDEDKSICQTFGVWVEKSMYGRKYMGVERSTFIIDESGVIRKIYRKVKVDGHIEQVITDLRNL